MYFWLTAYKIRANRLWFVSIAPIRRFVNLSIFCELWSSALVKTPFISYIFTGMLLRTKLILFAALCAFLPTMLSTYWSARTISESIETELSGKGLGILDQVGKLTEERIESIFSYSFLVMGNPALPLAIEKKSPELIASVAGSIEKGLNLDLLEIADSRGGLLYSAEGRRGIPSPIVGKAFGQAAASGRRSLLGLEIMEGKVAVEVATLLPSLRGPFSGVVVMGFYLDDKFFGDIKEVMRSDFCLFSKGLIVAQTLEADREEVARALSNPLVRLENASGRPLAERTRIGGEPYVLALKDMGIAGADLKLAALLSSRNAAAAKRKATVSIALAGLAGFGIAALLALLLSSRLMAPVRTLTRAAEEVGNGNLETRVPVASRDEIGFLSHAFNAMAVRLKEDQERLVRSERLAAIGQMASGVGHELRNPLAAIRNAIYFVKGKLMKDPARDPAVREMLDIAEKEIGSTVKISNDLLEFSRAVRINPSVQDVNSILTYVFNTVSTPQNVHLVKRLGEGLPPVNIDPERMRQVFMNLLNNAFEAMTAGGEVLVESCYNETSRVTVRVKDNGPGIPEKDRERIFEPLYSTKAKGTGLGLSIVRTIVETHLGTITLRTELGRGAEFTVSLPVAAKAGVE